MRAGLLRHRIVIQQPTETRDSVYGGIESTWATFRTWHAAVLPSVGNEQFTEGRERALRQVAFRMRWTSGITPKMRISWDDRIFDITSIQNIEERNSELMIQTEEVEA